MLRKCNGGLGWNRFDSSFQQDKTGRKCGLGARLFCDQGFVSDGTGWTNAVSAFWPITLKFQKLNFQIPLFGKIWKQGDETPQPTGWRAWDAFQNYKTKNNNGNYKCVFALLPSPVYHDAVRVLKNKPPRDESHGDYWWRGRRVVPISGVADHRYAKKRDFETAHEHSSEFRDTEDRLFGHLWGLYRDTDGCTLLFSKHRIVFLFFEKNEFWGHGGTGLLIANGLWNSSIGYENFKFQDSQLLIFREFQDHCVFLSLQTTTKREWPLWKHLRIPVLFRFPIDFRQIERRKPSIQQKFNHHAQAPHDQILVQIQRIWGGGTKSHILNLWINFRAFERLKCIRMCPKWTLNSISGLQTFRKQQKSHF